MELYTVIDEYLAQQKKGVVATVVKKLGAAPREVGAKMFIGEDGKMFGTVGGGCMEADVWQEAMRLMKTGRAKMLHFRMDGRQVQDEGMVCGGNIDVFLEPVHAAQRALFGRLLDLEKRGKSALVITRYNGTVLKSILEADGTLSGDVIDEETKAALLTRMNETTPTVDDGTIVEPLVLPPRLYLFGAGHVSQFVSRLAAMVDFHVTVIDDREDFANRERFPEASRVVVGDFREVFDRLDFYGKEFVVILTRGHKHDAGVLEEVMKRASRYVGMIGSRRKTKIVMDYLLAKGFDAEKLRTVHAPIGLDIGSHTPQEIAVSIVAELIKVRREGALDGGNVPGRERGRLPRA